MGLICMRFSKEVQEGKVTNAKNSFQNSITSKYLAQKLENKNSQKEKKYITIKNVLKL